MGLKSENICFHNIPRPRHKKELGVYTNERISRSQQIRQKIEVKSNLKKKKKNHMPFHNSEVRFHLALHIWIIYSSCSLTNNFS